MSCNPSDLSSGASQLADDGFHVFIVQVQTSGKSSAETWGGNFLHLSHFSHWTHSKFSPSSVAEGVGAEDEVPPMGIASFIVLVLVLPPTVPLFARRGRPRPRGLTASGTATAPTTSSDDVKSLSIDSTDRPLFTVEAIFLSFFGGRDSVVPKGSSGN